MDEFLAGVFFAVVLIAGVMFFSGFMPDPTINVEFDGGSYFMDGYHEGYRIGYEKGRNFSSNSTDNITTWLPGYQYWRIDSNPPPAKLEE